MWGLTQVVRREMGLQPDKEQVPQEKCEDGQIAFVFVGREGGRVRGTGFLHSVPKWSGLAPAIGRQEKRMLCSSSSP